MFGEASLFVNLSYEKISKLLRWPCYPISMPESSISKEFLVSEKDPSAPPIVGGNVGNKGRREIPIFRGQHESKARCLIMKDIQNPIIFAKRCLEPAKIMGCHHHVDIGYLASAQGLPIMQDGIMHSSSVNVIQELEIYVGKHSLRARVARAASRTGRRLRMQGGQFSKAHHLNVSPANIPSRMECAIP